MDRPASAGVAHITLKVPEVVMGIHDGLVVVHIGRTLAAFGRLSTNVAIIPVLVIIIHRAAARSRDTIDVSS